MSAVWGAAAICHWPLNAPLQNCTKIPFQWHQDLFGTLNAAVAALRLRPNVTWTECIKTSGAFKGVDGTTPTPAQWPGCAWGEYQCTGVYPDVVGMFVFVVCIVGTVRRFVSDFSLWSTRLHVHGYCLYIRRFIRPETAAALWLTAGWNGTKDLNQLKLFFLNVNNANMAFVVTFEMIVSPSGWYNKLLK